MSEKIVLIGFSYSFHASLFCFYCATTQPFLSRYENDFLRAREIWFLPELPFFSRIYLHNKLPWLWESSIFLGGPLKMAWKWRPKCESLLKSFTEVNTKWPKTVFCSANDSAAHEWTRTIRAIKILLFIDVLQFPVEMNNWKTMQVSFGEKKLVWL